jgi:hypothetical protein
VLQSLEQDHSMIARLLSELRGAVDRAAPPHELSRHLEGVAAIMENHFRYEERQLLAVLDTLELTVEPSEALGSGLRRDAVAVVVRRTRRSCASR